MALTKTKAVLIANMSGQAAGATTRGRLDVSDKHGGIVTMKIVNSVAGPTSPCEGRLMVSHEDVLPTAAAAGPDWKTVWRFANTTVANAAIEQSFTFGPEVRHLQVEFTGNTGQGVFVEALATVFEV